MHISHTLANLLDAGLEKSPDALAILSSKGGVSYRELAIKVDAIAQYLMLEFGINPGDRVVVAGNKDIVTLATVIAIWKIGAVYVPVDKKSPEHRLQQIITSVEAKMIVSDRKASRENALPERSVEFRTLDKLNLVEEIETGFPEVLRESVGTIIHTSGSTGVPKGVCLSHASTIAYFHNHNEIFGFARNTCSMSNGPLHFDVSIQDTFLPLYFGASVVLHRDLFVPSLIAKTIIEYKVTHLIAISSVLKIVSSDESIWDALAHSNLKLLMTGGEACPPGIINEWLRKIPALRAFYGYGPTECNSLCMAYEITVAEEDRFEPYPIGLPFSGHDAVLLDEDKQVISEPNVSGVLAVSGPQLMSGYWNKQELTESAFHHIGDVRYYITGDWCHRNEEGLYLFDGRKDTERKINGRRINLNEIKNTVSKLSALTHLVVDTVHIGEGEQIYLYAETSSSARIDENSLKSFLGEYLIDYMYPRYVVVSGSSPRTTTQKIDDRRIREFSEKTIKNNLDKDIIFVNPTWE